LTVAGEALAASPALVVDVDSGKVIYAEQATQPWFPASITKLMTAYVALQAVREGKVAIDTPLPISAFAASMPPSKMAFKPGQEVTLDNALKIIMVKSANDVSVTIAEGVGGSVEGFADMMNAAALRLGMKESRFVNPHGLPDERQQTSARDMAILGRALYRDFPEHRDLFQIGAIQFGRRVMANHNGLMGRYPGADGMKTGFICSSGFNVVASATRGGRRLITVVLGSPSAKERTFRASDLLDRGFGSFGWGGQSLEDLPPAASLTPPDLRPYICGGRGPVPSEEETQAAALGGLEAGSGNSGNALASLFAPPSTMAFAAAGSGSGPAPKRTLGPRAYLQPIPVWIGRTPPSALAAAAEPGAKPTRERNPAKAARKPPVQVGAADPTLPPASNALAATATPSIIDEGGPKGAIRPAAALNPPVSKPADAKPARAKPAALNPGAVGSGGAPRAKVGAIQAKPVAAAATPAAGGAPAAKPKPAAAAKPKPLAAVASPAASDAPAAKPKPATAAKPKPAPGAKKATLQAKPAKAKPEAAKDKE
jgi:D-alanyl-D-alanine carboxypeptidase